MTLGSRIYSLRKGRGLSQDELASLLNVSRQAVSKWELDTAVPDLDKMIRIAEVFNITLDELAGRGTEEQVYNEPTNTNQDTDNRFYADFPSGNGQNYSTNTNAPANNSYNTNANDALSRIIRFIKRYGYITGIVMSIGGVLFLVIGIASRMMFSSLTAPLQGVWGGGIANMATGPSNIVSTLALCFGGALLIGGIIIVIVWKRKFKE